MGEAPRMLSERPDSLTRMTDITEARAAAEASAQAADQATRYFESAVDDWRSALRVTVPATVVTQARRYVRDQHDVSLSLGRDRVQALKAEVEQLAAELKESIPGRVTPESVRSATPVPSYGTPDDPAAIAQAARRAVISELEAPLGRLLERYGYAWDGLAREDAWADVSTALEDDGEVETARKVSSTLANEVTAKRTAARDAGRLARAEAEDLW